MVSARTLEVRPVPVKIRDIAAISYVVPVRQWIKMDGERERGRTDLGTSVIFPGFVVIEICPKQLIDTMRKPPISE